MRVISLIMLFVIYQIHDFSVNNFHYHNANSDDYCSHYRTLVAIACVEAWVALVDHNCCQHCCQTDDDCNAEMPLFHLSCSDDDNAEREVDLMAMSNRNHLASEVTSIPKE
jgi:hypothetical protein